MSEKQNEHRGPPTLDQLKARVFRPKKAVVTAGMPYANGPLHLGHLAGAHVPADIHARYLRMLIGKENVLFVCGTDDHGSTSELSALQAGQPVREFIEGIRSRQKETLKAYSISLDLYTGTSAPETFETHRAVCHSFLKRLFENGLIEKRTTLQWFDPKINRFLQDRFVRGTCPQCGDSEAYSDECEACGAKYSPSELRQPRSALSDATPELRETIHAWLDLWKVAEPLRHWIQSKKGQWRTGVYNEVINTVLPSLRFDNTHEARYKEIKGSLPPHKSKYALGKKVLLQFEDRAGLERGEALLQEAGIPFARADEWAHRAITRDVSWGIPLPPEFGPEFEGKTLYVWPDSLIAPISFSQVALQGRGESPERVAEFWRDPEARVYQFLGQDNVYFYVLMQGALWLGSQADPMRLPEAGETQLTDVFGCFHLQVDGEKMSKSRGNFFTGDQMLAEKGYSADQIRYYLAILSLPEKTSSFDFKTFEERNRFLAGPMNAAFEKPLSACHSKFGGRVPEGKLNERVLQETTRIVQRYFKAMERADYATLLYAIENYARQINSLFTQFKPHDDRHPLESRSDALYSCFYVLKNLMILLYPFAPQTMDRLRESLRLSESIFSVDELGVPLPVGHEIGEQRSFFASVE